MATATGGQWAGGSVDFLKCQQQLGSVLINWLHLVCLICAKNKKLRLFFCFQQSCNVCRIRRTGKAPVIPLWECSCSCSGPRCHMICQYDLLLMFQLLTSETTHQQTACSSFKMANLYDERTWSAEMQTYVWKLRSCICICIGLNKWDITCLCKTVCEYSPDCQIISLKVQYVWI